MAQNSVGSRPMIAAFLTPNLVRARRSATDFRDLLNDKSVRAQPFGPDQERRFAKGFVARAVRPADGQALAAPDPSEPQAGWRWEDDSQGTHAKVAAISNSAVRFEDRFPAASLGPNRKIHAEPPSPMASTYMDAQATTAEKSNPTLKLNHDQDHDQDQFQDQQAPDDALAANDPALADIAPTPVGAGLESNRAPDALLSLSRQQPLAGDPQNPGTDQSDADAPNRATEEPDPAAHTTAHTNAPTTADSTVPSSKHATADIPRQADFAPGEQASAKTSTTTHNHPKFSMNAGMKTASITKWATKVGSITGRVRGVIGSQIAPAARVVAAKTAQGLATLPGLNAANFTRSTMKNQELPDNSLLELDTGKPGQSDPDDSSPLNPADARTVLEHSKAQENFGSALSSQSGASRSTDFGIVGAVQLTPDSPLPRGTNQKSVVQNPVVHGTSVTDPSVFKVSVTHAAPQTSVPKAGLARIHSGLNVNIGMLFIGGLCLIVGLAIIALLISLGVDALRGTNRIDPTAQIVLDTPVTALDPSQQLSASAGQAVTAVSFASPDLSVGEIRQAEELLSQLLFDPGQIDGVADISTSQAVQQFQAIVGGPAGDGTLTKPLLGDIRGMAFEAGLF